MPPFSSSQFSSTKRSYHRLIRGIGLSLVVLVLFVWQQPFVLVEYITRDPAAIARHPIYYGALSNLGVLLWSASATACLLGTLAVKALSGRQETVYFFTAFGILNALLCADDLFLIHESILPHKLGIPEEVMFAFYIAALSSMLLRFRKTLLRTQPLVLGTSLLLFALSVSSDLAPVISNLPRNDIFALEDGSKFIAIFVWSSYFIWTTVETIALLASSLSVRTEEVENARSISQK